MQKIAQTYDDKANTDANLKGIPIEFTFTPGGESDVRGFRRFEFTLEKGSKIYEDSFSNHIGIFADRIKQQK